ncbi:Hsp70 family protein, partial [Candidatus Riflebacteria bacterium]
AERELEESMSLELEVPEIDGVTGTTAVPVKLHSSISEMGTLHLWMQHTESSRRWELKFDVRME